MVKFNKQDFGDWTKFRENKKIHQMVMSLNLYVSFTQNTIIINITNLALAIQRR